ncbi:MAG: hypothetical protein IPH93_16685 [Saprospiraceae bacterium]|nr:hypothetical protein [Saprospiraceae bacterium]
MNSIGLKLIILFSFIFTSCDDPNEAKKERPDPHSFSRPQEAVTTHLELQLNCDFDKKILHGIASWDITNHQSERIIFDMMDLVIDSVMIVQNDGNRISTDFYVDNRDSILGDELTVKIKKNTNKVILYYSTTPDALALQWLDAELTLSKKQACLFTQSQSIYARSWIPCQDGPAIRFTYNANIQVPSGMIALMSASNPTEKKQREIINLRWNILFCLFDGTGSWRFSFCSYWLTYWCICRFSIVKIRSMGICRFGKNGRGRRIPVWSLYMVEI